MDEKGRMILYNNDGSETVLKNPFGPIKAMYDELRKDPNAIPELSDESRAAILTEIANGTAPKSMEDKYLTSGNRHDRRIAAALARKKS